MGICDKCSREKEDVEMRMFDSGSAVGIRKVCLSCFLTFLEETGFEPIGDFAEYCGRPQHIAHVMTTALNKDRSKESRELPQNWLTSLIKRIVCKIWTYLHS